MSQVDKAPLPSPSGKGAPPLLQARDVSVAFQLRHGLGMRAGTVHAVRGVDLDVYQGRTLAIVGESGSGKSTVARTMLGLQRPTTGSVLYRGRDIATLRGRDRREYRTAVQVVFQDPGASLNPRKSVRRTLAEVLLLHGKASRATLPERLDALLHSVGLDPETFLQRRPYQLSGGQKQRIAIARAIAVEPQVIIADEALSALDVSVQAQVLRLMERLSDDLGLAFLFITHDLGVAEEIADDVAVMYLGQVVEFGAASDVLSAPRHPYTRALLDSRLLADPRARHFDRPSNTLRGDLPSPTNVPSGCTLHPRCPHAVDLCSTSTPPTIRSTADDWDRSTVHVSTCLRADELDLRLPSQGPGERTVPAPQQR
jgi:oligopeptide/dipeptide ABC transporter ATP-binding protein